MTTSIPFELQSFVTTLIQRGEYQNETDVVAAALRLFQEYQLRKAVQAGIESGKIPAAEAFDRLEKKARSLAEGKP